MSTKTSSWVLKSSKLILKNLFVFFALITVLNIASILIYRSWHVFVFQKSIKAGSKLASYENTPWRGDYFNESVGVKYAYDSFTGWRALPFKGNAINIERSGERRTTSSDNSKKTIWFFGGSVMWGTGSNDENTIPSIVGAHGFHSRNFGQSGYNNYQATQFMSKLLLAGSAPPDFAVSLDGANEYMSYMVGQYEDYPRHSRESQFRSALTGLDVGSTLSLDSLFKPFYTLLRVFKSNADFKQFRLNQADIAARNFLNTWDHMRRICDSYGITFIPILQPVAFIGDPNLNGVDIDYSIKKAQVLFYESVRNLIPEYPSLKNIIIDMRNIFDGEKVYFTDMCHVTPEGNRIMSQTILDHVNAKDEKAMSSSPNSL